MHLHVSFWQLKLKECESEVWKVEEKSRKIGEREREWVCVCVWERERERERDEKRVKYFKILYEMFDF